MNEENGTSERFWFPKDAEIPLDDGYLEDLNDLGLPSLASKRLEDEAHKSCVVLLGAPGLGKTTEMMRLAEAARLRGEAVEFISLGQVSSAAALTSALLSSEHALEWRASNRIWNVFLDGIDEALINLAPVDKTIASVILSILQSDGLPSTLRLRLSCRSAEWPAPLEEELRTIWDDAEFSVLELAPFRRSDSARTVANSLPKADADRFLQSIDAMEVGPLASRPITLRMLVNAYQQQRELFGNQVQLYRNGLLALIEEANAARRFNVQTWLLDAQSKLIVAARIAASTVFSNSSGIWIGHRADVPDNRIAILSDLSGGHEPSLNASFPVGELELIDVLHTSLFTKLGTDLFAWSHKTFAEFLSAYYLVCHKLTTDEALSLLRGGDEAEAIPPQLHEVAAWLAGMMPDVFRALARSEPNVLLRSDVSTATPEDKRTLVLELLKKIDEGEAHDFQHDLRTRYDSLNYPDLASDLRPFIVSTNKNRVVRRVAIDLAEANNIVGLATDLVSVALNSSEDLHVRSQAAAAISKMTSTSAKEALTPFVLRDHPEDIDDDLKGYALLALWPAQLTMESLLAALSPPKDRSYFGAYYRFITDLELEELNENQALQVLEWLSAVGSDNREYIFNRLIVKLLGAVFDACVSPIVRGRLAEFLLGAARSGEFWSYDEDVREAFSDHFDAADDKRRALINELIARGQTAAAAAEVSWLFSSQPAIVSSRDLGWLCDELSAETEGSRRRFLVGLIVDQTFRQPLDGLSFVWEAARSQGDLSDALIAAYSVQLDAENARWQRDDWRRRQRNAESSVQPEQVLERIVRAEQAMEQDVNEWWRLNLLFFARLKDFEYRPEFTSDLTQSPFWKLLNDKQRSSLVEAGKRYLTSAPVDWSWLGTSTFHRPSAAGYRAIRLVRSLAPSSYEAFGQKLWRKWGPVAVGVSFSEGEGDNDAQREIVADAYHASPHAALAAVKRLISKVESAHDVRRIVRLFEGAFDERIGQTLWATMLSLPAHDGKVSPILDFLVRQAYAPARDLVLNFLANPASDGVYGVDTMLSAASVLLRQDTAEFWPYMASLSQIDSELFFKLIRSIAHLDEYRSPSFSEALTETAIADLFAWLHHHAPSEEKDRPVEEPGSLGELQRTLVQELVGRGTPAAVAALQELSLKCPDLEWLRWKIVDARAELAAKGWRYLDPAEVIAHISGLRPLPQVRSEKEAIKAAKRAAQQTEVEAAVSLDYVSSAAEDIQVVLPDKTAAPVAITPHVILTVATEWSSGHGGISTLNRQFCTALASLGHDVICLVPRPTPSEIAEALRAKVRLFACDAAGQTDLERMLLAYPSALKGIHPDVVVGHDHITGTIASHIAEARDVPYVHFVHTLPEEIEPLKSRSGQHPLRGGDKADRQVEQCRKSQLVVCVGPRIFAEMATRLSGDDVQLFNLLPGLDHTLLTHRVDLKVPRLPFCLFLGRLEDADLKGAGTACEVIRYLNTNWTWSKSQPLLILRGFDPDNVYRELSSLGVSSPEEFTRCRAYSADAGLIARDIKSSSLVMMPSKREAFGLVALEAIAAGIPVLISAQSGVAQFLLEPDISAQIGPNIVDRCIADVDGRDSKTIVKDWADRSYEALTNRERAFADAAHMRDVLKPLLTWERSAAAFSTELDKLIGNGLGTTAST
ncbi:MULTISPECIES: glycosyltransferase [Bradyrhizobium]|uniref:glycosyltransferase n=1 Tax=Bradyrhizobium TaxID=374 RepID=UPI001EDC8910|nr:glycosyltransferase [Bradyrhizobium zhengyangense]MCG2644295.1 glycosyltransferase [Bradyrhizobium zhengyangense]